MYQILTLLLVETRYPYL